MTMKSHGRRLAISLQAAALACQSMTNRPPWEFRVRKRGGWSKLGMRAKNVIHLTKYQTKYYICTAYKISQYDIVLVHKIASKMPYSVNKNYSTTHILKNIKINCYQCSECIISPSTLWLTFHLKCIQPQLGYLKLRFWQSWNIQYYVIKMWWIIRNDGTKVSKQASNFK